MRWTVAALAALVGLGAYGQAESAPRIALMPQPRQMTAGAGELTIGPGFAVRVEAPAGDRLTWGAAQRCRHALQSLSGLEIGLERGAAGKGAGLRVVVRKAAATEIGGDERYRLTVTPRGARLEAETSMGALRGLATFRQLLEREGSRTLAPAVVIEDAPAFRWRGLMIDTARHFIPNEVLQRNIDAMELVKLNVLHLHLSDNEGFRMESKVFPRLTAAGSGGAFYTQDQMRALIRYAAARGVVVVPEFDMPSHAMSWMAGYPELASSPGPFRAGPVRYPGLTPRTTQEEFMRIFTTTPVPAIDPSRETTYAFLDRFIGEMAALFPAPYFHIGGDENNGAVWRANPAIAAFMREKGMTGTAGLQAYFVARVKALVEKHGKRMVAWEEAYAGGKSSHTVFEAWVSGSKLNFRQVAETNGNAVLVANGFYLDVFMPAYVYYLNPALPASGAGPGAPIGGEAAMWTELADASNLEERIWPRAGAVAERLWTGGGGLNVDGMYARLFRLSAVLARAGVRHQAEYEAAVKRLAGNRAAGPVRTLLDVLAPVKGYRRLTEQMAMESMGVPQPAEFLRVTDAVREDSQPKREFRADLAVWLKDGDQPAEARMQRWLRKWAANDALLADYWAQSKNLAEVEGHSKRLAELAQAGLAALDAYDRGQTPTAAERADAEGLLKAARAADGETELAVLPELEGLLDRKLAPEPASYPLD